MKAPRVHHGVHHRSDFSDASGLASMSLAELADAVKLGAISYESVALEYTRRQLAGLDTDTGRPPEPSTAADRPIPAIRCRCCGALSPAPEGVTK